MGSDNNQSELQGKTPASGLSTVVHYKTQLPQLPVGHTDRSDILMSRLADFSSVIMLAPAGYGKTSVIAAALPLLSIDNDIIYYQCDRFDASPRLFIAACEKQLGLGHITEETPELEAVVFLLEEIRRIARPVTIVIDDICKLTYGTSQELVHILLRYRPDNLKLLFSGRYLPFSSGRLQLNTSICWLSEQDLAFTTDAFDSLLSTQSLMLPQGSSAVLVYQYQGWPAGLALWLMAWRSAGMPDRWSPNLGLSQLSDYLEGEVISGLSAELKEAVCAASALGTFNTRLLQECGDVKDAHTGIRNMLHRGLYLREVAGRPEWYRIDSLIGRSLARLIPQAEREQIHQKAYQWFRDRNDPIAAMYHVTQSGEHYSPEWLAGESDTILAELDTQGLTTWFDQLNEDQLHASPALMKIACWTHLLTYRLDAAEQLMGRLLAGPRNAQTDADAELYALQGYMAGLRGELTRAERFCRHAVEELPVDRVAIRFLVSCMLASVAVAHRDPDGSRVWNRLALDIARKAGKPALEAMAHLDHARIEFNRGNVSRCLQVLNYGCDVLDASQQGDRSMAYARLQILRATVGWITGVAEEKTDCAISKALILCEERSDPATTYGYAIRALNLMGEGQYSRALSVLDDGERRLQESRVDFVAYAWLHSVRSNIWISQKKYRRAYDCLEALLDGADSAGVARCEYSALLPGFSTLTLSRLYLMSGQIDDCLALTDRWLKNTPDGLMSVFIRLIRAGAFAVSSQTPESLRQIELVKKAFKARGVNSQLQSWLPDILPLHAVPEVSGVSDPAAALSDREKDVLKLMAQGLSNQDIAENLFISLHTVKTHARKVNVKLGTRSRTQAIHRAKELMII